MRKPGILGQVDQIVYKTAQKHGVRIYKYANVGNHLHILIKLPHVRGWTKFIRELAGRIALLMRKALALSRGEDFWLFRPHTRVISGWKKAFQMAKDYVHLNWLEGEGFINRKTTKSLKDLNQIWAEGLGDTSAWISPVRSGALQKLSVRERTVFPPSGRK